MRGTTSELLMQPGTAQTFTFGELAFRTVVPSAFSSAISLFEAELAPGTLSGPLHVHDREDAVSYVLEGCLTFQVGDEILDASAGTAVVQPRGVQHTFWNASASAARALDVVIPGGLERFYEDVAATIAGEPDALDRVGAMEERFGIRMDWSSLPVLLERHNLRPAAS
jgi:mannose-6-phosphate isomerase-like protein (cupin superfamily)